MTSDTLDLTALEQRLPELRSQFAAAQPFPHIVLDDVLSDQTYRAACEEFERLDTATWKNYVHVNERKHAHVDPERWGEQLAAVCATLQGERFVRFLEQLSGFESLHADPEMDGGGLHRMAPGGHLNIHADFTAHHRHAHWQRRINVLLYLNPGYEEAWGGELELWSRDMTTCEARVAPIGNRMLIFRTDAYSYHGHPEPLRFPEGRTRQSMALYYFSEEDEPIVRATNYRARPGDGAKALAIRLDTYVLRGYDALKRRLGWGDATVSRVLGAFDRRVRRR